MNIKYRAFISYSHKDKIFAIRFHKQLEKWKVRPENINNSTVKKSKYLRPIFLDRYDFSGGSSLRKSTLEALGESEYLIVICSPNSAKSENVNEEIIAYKSLGYSERIIPIIIAGEPYSETLECFPNALKHQINDKGEISNIEEEPPLAPDARDSGDGEKRALAKVVAGILDLPFDDIIRRADKDRYNKNASILGGVIGATIFSTLFSSYAIYQNNQSKHAINKSVFAISELINAIDSVSETNIEELRSEVLRSQCDLLDNLTSLKNMKIGTLQRTICLIDQAKASISIDEKNYEDISKSLFSMLKKQQHDFSRTLEPTTDQIISLLTLVKEYTSLQIEFGFNTISSLKYLLSISFELGNKRPDLNYTFSLHKILFWLLIERLESNENYSESIEITFKTVQLLEKQTKEQSLDQDVTFEYGLLLRRYAYLLNEHTSKYKEALESTQESINIFNKLRIINPNDIFINYQYMLANVVQGNTYIKLSDNVKAINRYNEALTINNISFNESSDDPSYLLDLLEKIKNENSFITKTLDRLNVVKDK